MTELPNDAVGAALPASIGPLETTLTVRSFEPEWTMVTHKVNLVHVVASGGGSNRRGGVMGDVTFTVSFADWRRLCRHAREEGSG